MTPALFFALIWAGWHPANVVLWRLGEMQTDACPAFQHSHASEPGDCFDNWTDGLVLSPGVPFS